MASVSSAPPTRFSADEMAKMSLSSKGVHADDRIAAHRAVAPAMHVSTTYRYSDDPTQLKHTGDPDWHNSDVSEQKFHGQHSSTQPARTAAFNFDFIVS